MPSIAITSQTILQLVTCLLVAGFFVWFKFLTAPRTYWRAVPADQPKVEDEETARDEANAAKKASVKRGVIGYVIFATIVYLVAISIEPFQKVQAALYPTATMTPSLTRTATPSPTLKPTLAYTFTPYPTGTAMTRTATLRPVIPTAQVIYNSVNVPVTVIVLQTRVVYVIQTVVVIVTQTFTPLPTDTVTALPSPTATFTPTATITETATPTPTETGVAP